MASIRKRNGKFQVQIRRKGQGDLSRTFQTYRDAQQWVRQTEAEIDRHGLAVDRRILNELSLGDLVKRYRDEYVPQLKGALFETVVLNAFLKHPLCKKSLAEVSTADFARYRDERLKHVQSATVKRQLTPLKRMFELAMKEWGLPLQQNPIRQLKLVHRDQKRTRRLSSTECEMILGAAKEKRASYLYWAIILALETGMRRGELLSLTWSDIEFEKRLARLRDTKNGEARYVPLTQTAIHTISIIPQVSNRMFPISANSLQLAWQRLIKKLQIDDLHFHDLRHEAISRLFEKGLTVPEVAAVSGHKDVSMLFRYAHADNQLIQQKLNAQPEVRFAQLAMRIDSKDFE